MNASVWKSAARRFRQWGRHWFEQCRKVTEALRATEQELLAERKTHEDLKGAMRAKVEEVARLQAREEIALESAQTWQIRTEEARARVAELAQTARARNDALERALAERDELRAVLWKVSPLVCGHAYDCPDDGPCDCGIANDPLALEVRAALQGP